MIYLSVILILLGIFIFIYSIILDSRKRMMDVSDDRGPISEEKKNSIKKKDANEKVTEIDRVFIEKDEGTNDENGNISQLDKSIESDQSVVFFEDSSNVVDYSNESGIIDPSLEGYKDIRRIGRGELVIEKEGINFYKGKKFYRFDFHRINDIKSGSKFLALFIDNSESVKLFLFEKESDIISRIDTEYNDYIAQA